MELSRRNFLVKSSLAAAGISVAANSKLYAGGNSGRLQELKTSASIDQESFKFSVFSKTLHWLPVSEMASSIAAMGFDGIDLTVRPNGHVLPERVEEDLPKATEAAKKAGISIFSIVTSINNADDPLTEKILKTASSLGIGHYRMDWLYYDDAKSIEQNMVAIQTVMSKLAVMNEKYKIRGEYQNHSGKYTPQSYFGSSIWDLYSVLNKINSPWLGSQYDIMHATVEGAYSWETDFKLLNPYIFSIAVKDYFWKKEQAKWAPEVVPLGEGMVDFDKYFGLIKQYKIKCPVSIHYEYPLGGAEKGDRTITMKSEDILSAIEKDLATLKSKFREANLID